MKPCCYSHSEKRPFVLFQFVFSLNCFPSSYLSDDNNFLIAGLITGKSQLSHRYSILHNEEANLKTKPTTATKLWLSQIFKLLKFHGVIFFK